MKTLKTIIPIGILLFTCLFAMGEKKQKSDTAGIAKIEQLMKSREFYIEVDQAFPTGNSSITIDSKYGQKRIGGEGYVSLATNEGQLFMLDTFYFTVLSEPSQDSSLMTKKNISVLNCIICFYSININTFYLIFIEFLSYVPLCIPQSSYQKQVYD